MTSDARSPDDSEIVAESGLGNSMCLKDWLYCCLCSTLETMRTRDDYFAIFRERAIWKIIPARFELVVFIDGMISIIHALTRYVPPVNQVPRGIRLVLHSNATQRCCRFGWYDSTSSHPSSKRMRKTYAMGWVLDQRIGNETYFGIIWRQFADRGCGWCDEKECEHDEQNHCIHGRSIILFSSWGKAKNLFYSTTILAANFGTPVMCHFQACGRREPKDRRTPNEYYDLPT